MTNVTVDIQENRILVDYISDKAETHFWGKKDVGHSRGGTFALQHLNNDTQLIVKPNKLVLQSNGSPLMLINLSEKDYRKIRDKLRRIT